MGTLVCNVRLHAQVDKSQILNRKVGRVDTADEAEAAAPVDLRAEFIQPGTKLREREGRARHMLAIKSET